MPSAAPGCETPFGNLSPDEKRRELTEDDGSELDGCCRHHLAHTRGCHAEAKARDIPAPRMLTPSEIEVLRRSVEEAAEVAGAFFERSEGDSKA